MSRTIPYVLCTQEEFDDEEKLEQIYAQHTTRQLQEPSTCRDGKENCKGMLFVSSAYTQIMP